MLGIAGQTMRLFVHLACEPLDLGGRAKITQWNLNSDLASEHLPARRGNVCRQVAHVSQGWWGYLPRDTQNLHPILRMPDFNSVVMWVSYWLMPSISLWNVLHHCPSFLWKCLCSLSSWRQSTTPRLSRHVVRLGKKVTVSPIQGHVRAQRIPLWCVCSRRRAKTLKNCLMWWYHKNPP